MIKPFYDDAVSEIYRLFSPNGTVPKESEVREIVRWIYGRGKAEGPAKIGRKGGSVSSEAKRQAALDREARKRKVLKR